MGKTSQMEKRLAGRVSLALAAGMFSVVPTAYGMPTLDNVDPRSGNVTFTDTTEKRKDIASDQRNNIINWKDFSVASDEHVAFDQNNYMNIVTGKATSAIDGKLTGGGDIYLINPNGVIFGKSAQVNVGNLYVSTREATDAMKNAFAGDQLATPDVNSVLPALNNGTSLTSEVVSLIDEKGYVAATKVVMEGRNIRFLNANALTTKNGNDAPVADTTTGNFSGSIGVAHPNAANVIFRANAIGKDATKDNYGDGYIHVGNGTSRYTAQYLNNHDATRSSEEDGVVNYSYLIRTVSDLQNINNDLYGNYMLTDDIDISTNHSAMGLSIGRANAKNSFDQPSGVAFGGHFDGMYYTIKNLDSTDMKPSSATTAKPYGNDGATYYMGLFAYTNGATIENVGVVNAKITTKYGGGVVGFASDTKLRNVWNAGGSNDNKYYIGHAYSQYVGGIVGYAAGTTKLTNVYNTGYVKGGGLVGALRGTSGIRNAYNIGKLAWDADNTKRYNGIVVSSLTGTTINNAYSASKYVGASTGGIELLGSSIGGNTTTNAKVIVDTKVNADDITLSEWIENAKKTGNGTDVGNTTISSEGASAATWRIYEGYSLPFLNSFMKAKGTVSTEYTYGDTDVTSSNYNKNAVPNKVYDAKTVMGDTPVYSYLGANVAEDTNLINVNNRQNVYTDTSGNAAKFALFSGGQQGYDLYGNNFKIEQRNISYDGSGTKNFSKEYDGTKDGTNALKALFSASSTSSDQGFLDADAANVKFVLGSGVSATYNDEDVLEANSFTISGTEASGAIKLEAAQGAENPDAYKNYKVGTVTNLDGTYTNGQNATVQITPRSIKVSLKETSGITKTYDGTATVTDQNKGETDGFLPNENVVIESGRVLDRDNGVAVTYNANARYVDVGTNGLTSAVNAGDHKVAYEGIALTGGDATKRANYKLVDSSNADLTAGYILADGTIAKRKITAADLTSPTGDGPSKTYDGSSTGTASLAVAVGADVLVSDEQAKTKFTGLLVRDKDAVALKTDGNVTFLANDGTTPTADASDATASATINPAKKARYTVILDTQNSTDSSVVNNYEIADNTQIVGNGRIEKRNISATLDVPNGGIVKTYDGTATVSNPQWQYAYSAGATTEEKKALEEIVGTDATISVTAAYKAGNGFGAKDVAYTDANSDTVTTKDIQYTLAISGTKAANYNLTAADVDSDNNALTGTIANAGKINPAALGLTITSVSKRYDTTSDVNTTAAPNTVANAITATTQNNEAFSEAAITGLYGVVNTNGTFTPDPNVAYSGNAVAEKDVQYSGFHAALGDNYKNYTIQGKTWKTSNTAYGKGTIYKAKIGATELAQKTNIVNPQPTLTKTYDGSTNYDVSGLTASDFLTVNYAGMAIPDNSLNYTIANAVYTGDGAKNVGTNKDMTMTFTFTTNGLGNFELTSDGTETVTSLNVAKAGFKGDITAKDLTLTLNQDAVSKVYDGTDTLKANGTTINDATIKGWFGLAQNDDIVAGDTVDIVLGANEQRNNQKAYYDDKNASTSNKNIYIYSVGLTGADAGNYNLKVVDAVGTKTAGNDGKVNNIQGVGTINKRTITVASVGAVDRDYNGSALVTKASGTNSAGVAYNDTIRITLNNSTQQGTADWDVLYEDGLLDGANRASTTGLIKNVNSITGTYQNSADNEGAANVRRASNNRDNILTKNVTYTGLLNALGGANGNYSIVDTATGQGTITPVKLKMDSTTVALPTAANSISRTYDATTAVTNPNTHLTISNATIQEKYNSGVLLLDEASYNNKNVGENKTVTYKFKLNPNENINNYDLFGTYATSTTTAQLSANVGKITPATIYAIGYKAADLTNDQKAQVTKVYDRTDTIPVISGTDGRLSWVKTNLAANGSGNTKYGTDDVSVVATSMAYDNKNAATSDTKMVYSGITLSGTDAGNYTLSNDTATGYGSITRKELEFTTANDKYYDGSAAATQNGVNPSDVNIVTAAVDAWKTAGDILYSEDGAGNKTYDDVTIAQLVGEYGTWNPSTDGQSGTWTPSSDVKRTSATDRTVQQRDVLYTSITLDGTDAGNYVVKSSTKKVKNLSTGNTELNKTVYFTDAIQKGTIRPIALTYSANQQESDVTETWTAANKVYDGTASVIGFDADGNPLTANNLTINYSKNGMTGTLDYNVVSAVYQSTTQGEADADAGTGKTVVYKVELAPLTLNNYDLDATVTNRYTSTNGITSTAGGNIARRLLVVSTDKESHEKIYDGSAALFDGSKTYNVARASATNKTSGIVDTDFVNNKVSVTYAANFADKDVNFNETAKTVDSKPVTYTFTLNGTSKNNYELTTVSPVAYPATHTDETWTPATGKLTKVEADGKIKQREVELALNGTIDKTYDGNADADVSSQIGFANKPRDVIAENIKIGDVTAKYQANGTEVGETDAERAKNVAFNARGTVTTKTVSVQNVNFLNDDESVNHNYVAKSGLKGSGKIEQRHVDVALTGQPISREYDGTDKVDYNKATGTYSTEHITIVPATGVNDGLVAGEASSLEVVSAIYYDKDTYGVTPDNPKGYVDAKSSGLGVLYRLKWNDKNYTLDHVALYGDGEIKKRTLTYNTGDALSVNKTYDGTPDVKGSSVTAGLFSNVVAGDEKGLLKVDDTSHYTSKNTGAAANSPTGTDQAVTVNFKLTNNNYQLATANNTGTITATNAVNGYASTGTYSGTGRIDRAVLTLTPNNVTYNTGDNIPTNGYAGSVSGFKGNDALADDYNVTFGRDNNRSTAAGDYTLLGYVNGLLPTAANGLMYYNDLGNTTGNYYFVQQPNQALHIVQSPQNSEVPNVVEEQVISDKKFTPDDYSYNRISQDPDVTRIKRESAAAVQYAEKGVNLDGGDKKSGLAALADIQGAGSVVNLNGALIQTSAPAEQPERVAEVAALPVPETDEGAMFTPLSEKEENDISSIDLEYADNTSGSQSVLEILTNASSNAENKGTSIVIDTQDEDEEDAEEEKSRRAIFADRSNIGIETLGNAVNLNQMIG